MAYKIFRKGNIIVLLNTSTGKQDELPVFKCEILQRDINLARFDVLDNKAPGHSALQVELKDIQKENGDPYTLDEFNLWRRANTNYVPSAPSTNEEPETLVEIEFTSAELEALSSGAVDLVASLSLGKHFKYRGVFEYRAGDVAFTGFNANESFVIGNQTGGCLIRAAAMLGDNSSGRYVCEFSSASSGLDIDGNPFIIRNPVSILSGDSLQLSLKIGTAFSGGNGSARVKLWYTTEDIY